MSVDKSKDQLDQKKVKGNSGKKITKIVNEKKPKKKKSEVGTDDFFKEWIRVTFGFFAKYNLTVEQAIKLLECLKESIIQDQAQD
jgi:hypothetical protein